MCEGLGCVCAACMSTFVSASIKGDYVGVNVRVNVCVSASCPLPLFPLSPGEEPVLKALLQSRALEARLVALYPDRGKPTVHHLS